jgi:hypothetical protein
MWENSKIQDVWTEKSIYDNFLKVNERTNDTRSRSRQSYAGNCAFAPRDRELSEAATLYS